MNQIAKLICTLPILALPLTAMAEEAEGDPSPTNPMQVNLAADMRFDFDLKNYSDHEHTSGFYGRFLNLILNGKINNQLSFSLRQRLNKFGEMKNDVFGATDWVYLNYSPTSHWTLSGGKQVVAIGGYEYDRNPINIYYASMFWYNIACYQFGVSATYHFSPTNSLLAQICNSPYQPLGNNCYAYNLMWMGGAGSWNTIWSANLMEWKEGTYGAILSLGNRFDCGQGYLEVDFMNRYLGAGHFWLSDYSLIGKACASVGKCDIFAKGGYEHFRLVPGSASTVDKPFYGVGVEFYPIAGSRDLRLHAVADLTHDSATGERCTEVAAGLMWRVNLINRKIK